MIISDIGCPIFVILRGRKMDFYHVLNRGVDKRPIVIDDRDRVRFLHDLFVMNDAHPVLHSAQPDRKEGRAKRSQLVLIHAFCLMGNHYHLLISETVPNGIPRFMQKLNMGYSKYFNERHQRTGTLWQGKYKKILIKRDAHFNYIPFYIHLNPLDFSVPEWRQGNVKNPKKALEFLRKYRWSSHLDYLGVKNFPSLTFRKEILDLNAPRAYEKEIARIIGTSDIAESSSVIEEISDIRCPILRYY